MLPIGSLSQQGQINTGELRLGQRGELGESRQNIGVKLGHLEGDGRAVYAQARDMLSSARNVIGGTFNRVEGVGQHTVQRRVFKRRLDAPSDVVARDRRAVLPS